jgi:hypothetical protein
MRVLKLANLLIIALLLSSISITASANPEGEPPVPRCKGCGSAPIGDVSVQELFGAEREEALKLALADSGAQKLRDFFEAKGYRIQVEKAQAVRITITIANAPYESMFNVPNESLAVVIPFTAKCTSLAHLLFLSNEQGAGAVVVTSENEMYIVGEKGIKLLPEEVWKGSLRRLELTPREIGKALGNGSGQPCYSNADCSPGEWCYPHCERLEWKPGCREACWRCAIFTYLCALCPVDPVFCSACFAAIHYCGLCIEKGGPECCNHWRGCCVDV